MPWTFVADVGGRSSYHVGDEAMLAANLDLFRSFAPSDELLVVSSDPACTAAEHGVRGLADLGFDTLTSDDTREELLARVSDPSRNAPDIPASLANLADGSHGLVISGGGNLNSTWPGCIYERLAFCRRAARSGAPIIILGQTIGPQLTDRHRELLAEILQHAWWIGVRETHSFARCVELGAAPERVSYQADDAAFVEPGNVPAPFSLDGDWIAVTINPVVDPSSSSPLLDLWAETLTRLAQSTGCPLVFLPHARASAARQMPWSDEDMGCAIASRMPDGLLTVGPAAAAREIVAWTARAAMIVSTRYHPLVFGLSNGVPGVGVWSDDYTRIKLFGALNHYNRTADLCGPEDLATGAVSAKLEALWGERQTARRAIAAAHRANIDQERARRHQLAQLVSVRRPIDAGQVAPLSRHLAHALREAEIATPLHAEIARLTSMLVAEREARQLHEHSRLEAEAYARALAARVEELTASVAEAAAYATALEAENQKLEYYAKAQAQRAEQERVAHIERADEATRYAISLRDEVERLRVLLDEAITYAESLEAERSRRDDAELARKEMPPTSGLMGRAPTT